MTLANEVGSENLNWPLMKNNLSREDLDAVIAFLRQDDPILTQSSQVRAFEEEWSTWLGVKYSVFVSSGSSANLLTMAALREAYGTGEILVPTLTWVSDFASVLHCGFQPVPIDINPRTLGMDVDEVMKKLTTRTKAVFLTHIMGYNALDRRLLNALRERSIPLIEDACESYGATFQGRKVGSFGLVSNFSFYYGHHLTTIEGGMICTEDADLYEIVRMMRAHGMAREAKSEELKARYAQSYPDLSPDFIFVFPAYNVRSTEINALLGRTKLKRLDEDNRTRSENLKIFLESLDPVKYRVDFESEGNCNYAFTLVLQRPDAALRDRVTKALKDRGVEFRRGTSGGGNQLRQPYLRRIFGDKECEKYPNVEHIHFFGFYIGNYPTLEREKITKLCAVLNDL